MANESNVQNKNTSVISNGSLAQAHNDEEEAESYAYAGQILNSCVLPMVLNATIELGVLKIICGEAGSAGLSPTELAAAIKATNSEAPVMLDRMLRVLATYSVVSCDVVYDADGAVERRYGPAPVTKWFVPDQDGVSLTPMLNLAIDKVYLSSW